MHITKLGHCCLLIETKEGKRILTDPGVFTRDEDMPDSIDIVVISHEHADHIHIESLQQVLKKNPALQIVCNSAVGALLEKEEIQYTVLEGSASTEIQEVFIQAHDATHAEIYKEYGQVQNTGYFITHDLFYPGDSFEEPVEGVRILALPVAGPWCKIGDAIRYALAVKPQMALPVHDGIEREDRVGVFHNLLQRVLGEEGIDFRPMKGGDSEQFDI